jgi:hypothetical protein
MYPQVAHAAPRKEQRQLTKKSLTYPLTLPLMVHQFIFFGATFEITTWFWVTVGANEKDTHISKQQQHIY